MADLPYYLSEGGMKKHAEGLIPIIILVLIAVVLVGKTTNFFCDVPGLNSIFCPGGQINIAVIGKFSGGNTMISAPELKALLDGDLGRACNMQYQEFEPEDLVYVKDALFHNYDLVILVGDTDYKRPVRDAVESYLSSGGKLILIGDAATKDPDDPLYNGWGHLQVPIQLRTTGIMQDGIPYKDLLNPVLKVSDINHPIVVGYGFKLDLTQITEKPECTGLYGTGLKVIDVYPTGGGTILYMSGTDMTGTTPTGETVSVPAVVEQSSWFGGHIYYFAFDPGCIPNMWISTAQQITGKGSCTLT